MISDAVARPAEMVLPVVELLYRTTRVEAEMVRRLNTEALGMSMLTTYQCS